MIQPTLIGSVSLSIHAGYSWYTYPVGDTKVDLNFSPTVLGMKNEGIAVWLPMCNWSDEIKAFGNYSKEGVIFLTESPEKPTVPAGWEVVPIAVPEGFGYYDAAAHWKVRHIHSEKSGDALRSIFVGVWGISV
jgi:hypothetical protein